MLQTLEFSVSDAFCGKTLKTVLKTQLELSNTAIKKAKFTPGGLLLNGVPVTVSTTVRTGDHVLVLIESETDHSENVLPSPQPLDIVFEDEHLLVCIKPAGVRTHPANPRDPDSMAGRVLYYWQTKGEPRVARPVQRLDRGTSGLQIFAKHAPAHAALQKASRIGTLQKIYLALVGGQPDPRSGTIDLPIGRVPGSLIQHGICSNGKPAVTHYRTLCTFSGESLIALTLDTGRTHQIRVHLSHLGHPLIGDFLYGTEQGSGLSHTALHVWQVRFPHPFTGEILRFFAPLPDDLKHKIKPPTGK